MSKEINNESRGDSVVFETLRVCKEAAVLFVEIAAPPMNLLGPEMVRDLVSLIQRAEAAAAVQVLKSANPDYFHFPRRRLKLFTRSSTELWVLNSR